MSSNTSNPGTSSLSDAKRALLAQRMKSFSAPRKDEEQIQPRPAGAKTPISVDQYRIWLHASMQPELPTYNEPIMIQYRGELDLDVLTASVNYFIQRHEAMRTSFRVEQEEVLQVVHPELKIDLPLFDLSELPEAEREAKAHLLATQQALRPIALDQVPLFRSMVVKAAGDDYRLYMVLHHIVFDGLSIQETFIPELAVIYASLKAGHEPALLPRTLQYPDYAVWRQEQVKSPAMEQRVEYWRKQLAGELPVLRLPVDRPRPATISHRGAIECFSISQPLTHALREFSHAHGVTLYMTMLAAYKVLLFRYSGQEDVIVGGGADGRRRPELRGMMGYMLDTFAVRTHPSATTSFLDYLAEVKNAALGALDGAEVPFERIVQALGIKRDPSYHPIFQTFFSFLAPGGNLPAGWDMKPKDVNGGAAKFDIYLEVEESPTHTAACIIYNTDLFDAATIRRMEGQWITVMEAICRTPECAIGDLPLLTPEEQDLMLVQWNDTATPLPVATMHSLVEAQVQRTPDKPAITFEERTWTYAELDQHAERLATHLRRAGAGPGTLVALCIDRSEFLPASLIAILKTGAAYLPLDPGTPLARIVMCLEDAAPAVVFTQRSLMHDLPCGNATVLILEDVMRAPAVEAPAAPAGGPDDVAYVIHTSGSTGRPKAVELPHGAVVNLLLSMQQAPGFTADDTLVAVTTISFDIAVLELFLPLITGGHVILASRAVALDPFKLASLIENTSCTVMQATPATWRALLAVDWPGYRGMRALCGGEALTRDLAERLLALDLDLWNVYGPTETTIWSTCYKVQHATGSVPVGRPIANTTIYILDANRQPVPIGVAGDLYIGGAGLANGYRGQPELTAQKFVTPAITHGARIYNTGDYALYRANGVIECQGRADNQVKIRGYRIELEEVELHLNAHTQIAVAAARTWADPTGGHRISAYFVTKGDKTPTVSDLRDFLRERLPDYMIPSDFTALATIPLTANGKMDRKALPQPDQPNSVRSEPAAALTPEEKKMANIWASVLDLKSVNGDDNFFDLGGHSLLLVILFARINKEFAASLPITTIFDAQTLSALTRTLTENVRISSLVPVQVNGTKPPLFMAHSYLLYRSLSSALGNDQPFYGLRELEKDANLSIEERARQYVTDMRKVQPHGPYRVAGWCAAGPLAVEISRQLILAGEQVAHLGLFDSWLPGYVESLEHAENSKSFLKIFRGKYARYKTKVHGLSLGDQARHIWRTVSRGLRQSRDRFYINHWASMNHLSQRLNIPLPQFMHNTTLQTFAAMKEFRAESLPVRMTLIRATESRQIPGSTNECGWEKVAQLGVDVLWAPGDHETMFRGANLQVTAKLVAASLETSFVTSAAPVTTNT